MLELYNTLSKKIEQVPKKDHLNLYTCGPTVYNYAHIGNLRSFIMADLLYRTLKYDGYKPRWVMNVTDVDDKTIRDTLVKYGQSATVENLREFTGFYLEEFLKDLREVNVLVDEIKFIRVSDVIPQIQQFVVDLVKKGYAYVAEDGIYFSIQKYQQDFGDYGALVGEKFLEGKKIGARVQVDEYEKENLSDFALWKVRDPATEGQIFWSDAINDPEVKIPNGRPGWHIECSVINKLAFNGEPTDIHTGGVDLIFPHHTNEIAQSQALLGKGNFVHHWFHSEHLLVDVKKMAKSANNFYTLKDLKEKSFFGQDLRYLFFTSSFSNQQNFTFQGLEAVRSARAKIFKLWSKIPNDTKLLITALNGNLNAPQALSVIWSGNSTKELIESILGLEPDADLDTPDSVKVLLDKRIEAKNLKNYQKSDELRKQIEDLGYEVMDMAEGQKIRKKI